METIILKGSSRKSEYYKKWKKKKKKSANPPVKLKAQQCKVNKLKIDNPYLLQRTKPLENFKGK